jgi:hypothetical protein
VASQEIPRIFMEPEGSLPQSQVPTTCPYPEPTQSNPHHPLQLEQSCCYFKMDEERKSKLTIKKSSEQTLFLEDDRSAWKQISHIMESESP